MSLCRSCKAPIEFLMTEAGKFMPVDVSSLRLEEAKTAGNVVTTGETRVNPRTGRETPVVRVDDGPSLLDPPDAVRYFPHHSSCPDADRWRR